MKAPLPGNEAQRLESLRSYEVLDTAPEAAFDDLTLLAAQICGVPTAMVSLVDENRQWFKSRLGISATGTPRDIAFCAHTILQPHQVLEVRDAGADPRFAGNPLVREDPHIRFYAGAPLVTGTGHALGALCVMDTVPRNLTVDQLAALEALGRRVVAQLELRRQARSLAAREHETARLLELAEKSRRALLSVLEDEKLAARNLRESEERFRNLIENASDMIAIVDEDGVICYQSPSTPRLLGYATSEMLGRPAGEYIHPDDRAKVGESIRQALLAQDQPVTVEFRIRHKDGTWRVFQSSGKRMLGVAGKPQIVVNSRDITENRRLEQQFLHAQRMEAIGTLASGVAHDLNNILAPMLMVAGILKLRSNSSPRDLELLAIIENSGHRGAAIIRQLLAFSRGLSGDRVTLQPKHLVHEMVKIMSETFPRNITITESAPTDLWTVEADATQLHQVLMNLCVNARDAMPAGGNLTMEGSNLALAAAEVAVLAPAARPGPYVLLQVRDTGTGIPPEIVDRIFDPFFSTKGVGKGTGLGLSTVVGIIRNHGGFVKVISEPGRGSIFQVYLPAVEGQEMSDPGDVPATMPGGNGEQILIVDDEEPIREAAGGVLTRFGYRVLLAASGEEAMKMCLDHQGSLRLVITDIMMPGMDGLALIRALRVIDPAMRIIVSSGLIQGQDAAEFTTLGVGGVLAKPFAAAQLLKTVASVLTAPNPPGG
jgi:two-component system cell cycle sensor histidine kinase/response regulator CckA